MTQTLPTITITERGIAIAGNPDVETFMEAFTDAVNAKNRSQWVIGDLYAFAEDTNAFGEDWVGVLDPALIGERTAANYASVSRAWRMEDRAYNVSFSHYDAAKKLARQGGDALHHARMILKEAERGNMDRDWVRDEVKRLLNEPIAQVFKTTGRWQVSNLLALDDKLPGEYLGKRLEITVRIAA